MDRYAREGRRRRRRITYMSILGIMLLLHALAWSSERFCDWYAAHVFRIWVETYGRAMGMVPFSVGEALTWLGLGFGALGALLGLIWLAGRLSAGRREEWGKKGGRRRRFCQAYCMTAMWILLAVFVLTTLNCYLLYHTSGFGEKYLEASAGDMAWRSWRCFGISWWSSAMPCAAGFPGTRTAPSPMRGIWGRRPGRPWGS